MERLLKLLWEIRPVKSNKKEALKRLLPYKVLFIQ
jgi:hypothetical protein